MADFCKQCSLELFGEDFKDLAGLGQPKEGYGWLVLCEGCGPTLVNDEGECVDPECKKHGGRKDETDL